MSTATIIALTVEGFIILVLAGFLVVVNDDHDNLYKKVETASDQRISDLRCADTAQQGVQGLHRDFAAMLKLIRHVSEDAKYLSLTAVQRKAHDEHLKLIVGAEAIKADQQADWYEALSRAGLGKYRPDYESANNAAAARLAGYGGRNA